MGEMFARDGLLVCCKYGRIWGGIGDINVKDCRLYDTIVVPVYWILAQVGAYSVVAELFLICTLKLLDTAHMRVQKLQLNLRWDVGCGI